MNKLLPLLLVLPLAGCLATAGSLDELKAALTEFKEAQANPATTQAELDALAGKVAEKLEASKEAPAKDIAAAKDWFLGLTESQAGGVGVIGSVASLLAWWLNRKQTAKLAADGKHPVQVAAQKAGVKIT